MQSHWSGLPHLFGVLLLFSNRVCARTTSAAWIAGSMGTERTTRKACSPLGWLASEVRLGLPRTLGWGFQSIRWDQEARIVEEAEFL